MRNMEEVRARKGKIIAIATEGDEEIKKRADHVIYVPETHRDALAAAVGGPAPAPRVLTWRSCAAATSTSRGTSRRA